MDGSSMLFMLWIDNFDVFAVGKYSLPPSLALFLRSSLLDLNSRVVNVWFMQSINAIDPNVPNCQQVEDEGWNYFEYFLHCTTTMVLWHNHSHP